MNSLFISEKIKVDQSPIINYQIVNPTAKLSANILAGIDNNSVAFSLKTTLIEDAVNDAAKTKPYQLSIISWQTYAQISETYHFPVGEQLQGDETKLLLAQENTKDESNTTQKLIPYQLKKQTVKFDVSNVSERQNVFSRYDDYLVVSQQKYKTLSRVVTPTSVLYIKMKAQQDSPQVVKTIKHVLKNAEDVYLYSVEEDANFFNLTFGIIMYIGIFLALVFIVATGTIIYFKQMLDATKAKQTYQTLYRMGVSYEEMRMIVIKQLGFVFFMPLLLAIVHSLFALKAFYAIIESSFDPLILGSILLYALIYFVYYVMGVHHYLKIVCPPEMRTTI
ncbi:ABC transporter permease [Brochothrix campestris FSL F6-1037]|uniref:ABC transporter permease n=1 Tax=Brochothrix campestris FSL F6-1037 TaxID=1265861 RepID=W7CWJ4_9LIST|nr:ABC transporter permease [Brochothrix campestris FSL F6-1037]